MGTLLLSGCGGARPALAPTRPGRDARQLQRDIDAILAQPTLESGVWGIVVRSLSRKDTLYSLNARKLLMPASSLKIVTLAVAAETLGWDYTYQTRLIAAGPIRDGVLEGDLVVVGSGDPSLTDVDGSASRVFAGWATDLKLRGVRAVAGRIVGVDDAFDDETIGAGWMWDDLAQAFSAGVGALQLGLNATRVSVLPGSKVGAAAAASLASEGSGLTARSLVTTGAAGAAPSIRLRRVAGSNVVEMTGTIALDSGPVDRWVAVDNPTAHFVVELKKALVENGITVTGPAVDADLVSDAPAVDGGAPLVVHKSPPLSALAVPLMKQSQNQYAETLLKTLGASAGTGTFDAGRKIVLDTLEQWGVDTRGLVLADGSGLSRYDLVTCETLTAILSHVSGDDRLSAPFDTALPVAGRDGTLAERLKGTAAEGNARAKTGSMTNVRSLAGFVTAAGGERLVFAIVANNFGVPGGAVDQASDAILVRLATFGRAVGAPPQ